MTQLPHLDDMWNAQADISPRLAVAGGGANGNTRAALGK